MIDSVSSHHRTTNTEHLNFARTGLTADGVTAARVRKEFSRWLECSFELNPDRMSDLVLATNEALANAAEFAYVTADQRGTMDLRARYDSAHNTLTVTVSDNGLWRMPNPHPVTRERGRGLPLMHTLSDRCEIERSDEGTLVCMEWAGVQTAD